MQAAGERFIGKGIDANDGPAHGFIKPETHYPRGKLIAPRI